MPRILAAFAFAAALLSFSPACAAQNLLRPTRTSAGDLEVAGELKGVPAGQVRYIRYEDLLQLPQESYTVPGDTNFKGTVKIEGVSLQTLERLLGAPGVADLMPVAICYDRYRTNYPPDYIAAHHPLLVLRINGKLRDGWPPAEGGGALGPYLISHPHFRPAFRVLSHDDEPQIPYGVVRLELRSQSAVFAPTRPPGIWPPGSPVMQGWTIARQDCFRCHNAGAQGGAMAGVSWRQLGENARDDPARFRQTIHDPASLNPAAKMPAHLDYDDATLEALTQYFRTFAAAPH